MKRLSLLLLDANVVIYLFELGIWGKVVSLCDIHLACTVIDEARFYEDDDGVQHPFDLSGYVDSGAVAAFDVLPSQMEAVRSRTTLPVASAGTFPVQSEGFATGLCPSCGLIGTI